MTTAPSPWLLLGRVSNLPTVWSNVLAAVLIASPALPSAATLAALLAGMSLFYVGGMYLNDAFDREIDARERPTRPIPSGRVAAATVFALGFGMLAAGGLLVTLAGGAASLPQVLLLAGFIVGYNVWHKGNPCSPLVMGGCRALVYLCAGSAVAPGADGVITLGALAMLAHIVGLTHAAKQEGLNRLGRAWPLAVLALPLPLYAGWLAFDGDPRWSLFLLPLGALAIANLHAVRLLLRRRMAGDVKRAVGGLIAATSLLDAVAIAACTPAALPLAATAVAACALAYAGTRALQRVIPGT